MEILIIILFNALLYYKTIWFLIIVDDVRHYKWLKENNGFNPVSNLPLWRRPIAWIQQRLYGAGLFGWRTYKKDGKEKVDYRWDHLAVLVLHTINCILIYLAFGKNIVSWSAAMLYACNPANTQTSIWLNGRRYAVCVFLTLLMILAMPYAWLGWGLPFYLFTPIFQLTAVFAPVMYGLKAVWIWLLAPIIIYLMRNRIVEFWKLRTSAVFSPDHLEFTPKRLIVCIKSFGFYVWHMIFPGHVRMTYDSLYWWGRTEVGNKEAYAFNWDFWKGVLCFVGMCAVGYFVQEKWMWLFMMLAIAQWCCVIVCIQYNTDRYASIPIVFMMYFLCQLSYQYVGWWSLLMLAVYYVVNLQHSMRQYKSMQDFMDYHAYHDPLLPKTQLEEVKALFIKDNFHARIRAMAIIDQLIIRYKCRDYDTLRFAADSLRLWGLLEEAVTLSHEALNNPYIGCAERAKEHHAFFMERIKKDLDNMGVPSSTTVKPSRQVRRAEARKQADNAKTKE